MPHGDPLQGILPLALFSFKNQILCRSLHTEIRRPAAKIVPAKMLGAVKHHPGLQGTSGDP